MEVKHTPEKPEWFRRHSSQVEGELNWVAASGAEGLETLTVTLGGANDPERTYTVRLHFCEPGGPGRVSRVFHVDLQGKRVLDNLSVSKEAGGPSRALVKEFKGVKVGRDLTIRLTPADPIGPLPILSGVEVVAEGW